MQQRDSPYLFPSRKWGMTYEATNVFRNGVVCMLFEWGKRAIEQLAIRAPGLVHEGTGGQDGG